MMERRLTILQTDPKASYLAHKAEIDAAIGRVLDSGWYILGREVAAFEEEFAAYIGVRHAIGVASGTDALEIALRTCGIGPGDLVFTVSHTAVATVAAIERCGATPILVDIDPGTYTLDAERFEDAIVYYTEHRRLSPSSRPSAIVPVHLYGHPADMPAILDIARRYGLYVVEDCAQSHGATVRGKKTGGWGQLAAFSFYPTKNLGALGDGGAVVTDDENLAERARLLRQYGWRQRYISESVGMNSRLDELQAAILRVKLHFLDEENDRRRIIACLYANLLADLDLGLPWSKPECEHVYHQFVIRTENRDALQLYLRERGIGTAIHYPVPVHLQPAYVGRLSVERALPNTERVAHEVLSLPMYPELTEERVVAVAKAIREFQEHSRVRE